MKVDGGLCTIILCMCVFHWLFQATQNGKQTNILETTTLDMNPETIIIGIVFVNGRSG